jgi:hypothetical protein
MEIVRRLVLTTILTLLLTTTVLPVASTQALQPVKTAPTYTVFATREGLVGHRTANGHRIRPRDRFVALPSFRVLSSLGGYEYQVRVTYRDRSVVLPVWDVGPWNTKDDYWSPQRRYSDLPVGKPMAQAAYQDGYNGGRDEFGRRIGLPNGIDIADGAFWDDLGMVDSDWVEVTFLWLGEDPYTQGQSNDPITVEDNAIVIDDSDNGYNQNQATWYRDYCGMNGDHRWTYSTNNASKSENLGRWEPQILVPNLYEAFAYIPKCGRSATQSAQYTIKHDGASSHVSINQQAAAGSWVSLGTYHFGSEHNVIELSDLAKDSGQAVRYDAIKLVPRQDSAPPEARVTSAEPYPEGGMVVHWQGSDDASGVASYDIQIQRLSTNTWIDWQINTTATKAVFVPPEPGSYVFRARARDWLGNTQAWRDTPDLQLDFP